MKESPDKRWCSCFLHAGRGLSVVFRSERNFRIHLVLLALALALGFVVDLSGAEWLAVVLCSALVLVAETFNSALEYLADALRPEIHPAVGRAKDASAGAVLLAAVAAAIVGAIVFLPKLWHLWTTWR